MLNKKLKYSNMFNLKCKHLINSASNPLTILNDLNLIDCGEPTYIA